MHAPHGGLTIFYDSRNGDDLSHFFEHVEPYELREGNTISMRRRGQNRRYYRIVRVEPGFHPKVIVRRIWLHVWDLFQLTVIAGLCWFVFDKLVPFFLE